METSSKSDRRISPAPKSQLLLASPALTQCVFGAFVRDTRGCDLSFDQRFNHFAASPLCCISWFFEGDCFLLDDASQMSAPDQGQPIPRLSFSGPQNRPRTSWNPGETHAMILAFYPDAFSLLTGIKPGAFVNQTVPAHLVLPDAVFRWVETVAEMGDAVAGFEHLETVLDPVWKQCRTGGNVMVNRVSDWTRALAMRAMFSAVGRSSRQIERRIKVWTGHSNRELRQYARTDRTYEQALSAKSAGGLDLADLAFQLGFSDQAHMTRQVKKQTGYSPAELMRRIEEEEPFWSFRLLGERY